MKYRRGFTLIELLVVIAIVSMLSGIIFTSVKSARDKAKYARTIQDMMQIAKAAEIFHANIGDYPEDAANGQLPPGATAEFMRSWPLPQCSNWTYDYDYWRPTDYGVSPAIPREEMMARIVLLNDGAPQYYYCIKQGLGMCKHPGDETQPLFTDLRDIPDKVLSCL